MKVPDITRRQLVAKLERLGFRRSAGGPFGHWQLPGMDVFVSEWNAPRNTNRARLAYLIQAWHLERDRACET